MLQRRTAENHPPAAICSGSTRARNLPASFGNDSAKARISHFDAIAVIRQAATVQCMDTLRLRYSAEDERHGELFADVESGRFRGSGSAWFPLEQLRDFWQLAGAYPIAEGEEPLLAGGIWDERGEALKECHLSIRFSPHGRKGSLKASMIVASDSDDEGLHNQTLTASFRVSYGDVERFRIEFGSLLEGQSEQAVLRATPS
jgi:hypothetical protein